MDDDRTYRFTRRRGSTTANLRDVIAGSDNRKTQDLPPVDESPVTGEPLFATGSQRVPTLAPMHLETEPLPPQIVIERRMFAGIEIVIEHCGDCVTIVVPGAGRLVGNRDEAIDLMAALLGPR